MNPTGTQTAPRLLTGWGGTLASRAELVGSATEGELSRRWSSSDRAGILARGAGCAYGDAALNAGGVVVDMRSRDHVLAADLAHGLVTVEAGVRLGHLLAEFGPQGWTLPVIPGTAHVSVGGAIASDVHGKNHRTAGSFCQYVTSMDLLTGHGEVITVAPDDPRFRATAGGMGLTGIVLRATLQLVPVASSSFVVRRRRLRDLDALLAAMSAPAPTSYTVAWIDVLSKRQPGRGVLSEAEHATEPAVAGSWRARRTISAPKHFPPGLLNRHSVAAFNQAYFQRAPRDATSLVSASAFLFPLDAIANWNRAYGRPGFVQYQFVVPIAAVGALESAIARMRAAGVPGLLAVLKRLGAGTGLLSFPIEGWSLAVDMPAGLPGLAALLRVLDELVVEAGGRVYLAKDSRLTPEVFAAMYPELPAWQQIRDKMDPGVRAGSDLGRRLGLVAAA